MFERFTESARQVIVNAQEESRALHHNNIGTEHLLLGLLHNDHNLASSVLESLDVTLERARAQMVRTVRVPVDDFTVRGKSPLTPRATKVLELAFREALSLDCNYIGPVHILLGLVREGEGVGMRVLEDFDVDADRVRDEIARRLTTAGTYRIQPAEQHKRPEPTCAGEVEIFLYDQTGRGFAKNHGRQDEGFVYLVELPKCPWTRLPQIGEQIEAGGNYVRVTDVFFNSDGSVELHLSVEEYPQNHGWHEALLSAGYRLIPE